ncbi:UNVERIFIED_CONTAM: hypothetical protein FKN15_063091 [Acipenser sinensis]
MKLPEGHCLLKSYCLRNFSTGVLMEFHFLMLKHTDSEAESNMQTRTCEVGGPLDVTIPPHAASEQKERAVLL